MHKPVDVPEIRRENHLGCIKPVVNNLGETTTSTGERRISWTINSMEREIPQKLAYLSSCLFDPHPKTSPMTPELPIVHLYPNINGPKWSQDTFSSWRGVRGVLSLPASTFLEAGDVSEGTSVSWCSWCSWFLVSVSEVLFWFFLQLIFFLPVLLPVEGPSTPKSAAGTFATIFDLATGTLEGPTSVAELFFHTTFFLPTEVDDFSEPSTGLGGGTSVTFGSFRSGFCTSSSAGFSDILRYAQGAWTKINHIQQVVAKYGNIYHGRIHKHITN